ncbi:hypothetical protein NB721_000794 [Xanthomonas sacchari]|nr:hypothetical protein [Xanthomonas sacchari]
MISLCRWRTQNGEWLHTSRASNQTLTSSEANARDRDQTMFDSEKEQQDFCLYLWFELTIAGRAIWSDDQLDQPSKFETLKWLNEVQHHVYNAYRRSGEGALSLLFERVTALCKEAPCLTFHVRVAVDRAVAKVASGRIASSLD